MATRVEETDPLKIARDARRQAGAAVSQLDALKGSVNGPGGLSERIEAVEKTVRAMDAGIKSLTDALKAQQAAPAQSKGKPEDEGERDWLTVTDALEAFEWLDDLSKWHDKVFRRMAGKSLPECWPWHSRAVEVLLALQSQREASFTSPTGVSDFRGRWLPTALGELEQETGGCGDGDHVPDKARHYAVDLGELYAYAEWHVAGGKGLAPGLTPIT